MSNDPLLNFVSSQDIQVEQLPWGPHHWLCRLGLTDAENLQLVRVNMSPGKAHQFHRHPSMEEIIYVLDGHAEQWVGRKYKVLGPGEMAHIPVNKVHGTYNSGKEALLFLAILSPAKYDGPALIDVSKKEPWCSIKPPMDY